ncbi:response regulator transcription factor [Peptoniphilus sp. BV3AC2]|uniref:response regulator transcription factor n=1 Tax=Peptoniphilus sp. BV3AC2 TaxID=1111133 RepID=UPI0003B828FC|nr:response regulator transcription factor [Peptoniphilus sp. BV3AC2]ERT62905.1 response regulator receiver domain protein [Peptoniphilus sp. BV3AC2]
MKILLLDDHKILGQSIKMLLEEESDVTCDYISSSENLMEALENSYDILLLDINLKAEKTGLDLVEEILKRYPKQKIVILTSYDLVNYRKVAFDLGVKDFINKSVEASELVNRLRSVNGGGKIKNSPQILETLTEREVEVLREMIKGENKKDIAKKLYISERTLYNHISNIYEKLGAKNIVEAYNRAMELGYIDPVM